MLANRKCVPAYAAEQGELIPFGSRPNFYIVIRQGVMTILAGVETITAFHLDRDDVHSGAMVSAARLRVNIDSVYLGYSEPHTY